MKIRLIFVVLLSAVLHTLAPAETVGQAFQRQRIQSSYLIAFGRKATDPEVAYWQQQNPKSVGDLVTNHRNFLMQDAGTHRETIRRSYIDAMGRNPNDGEIKHWMAGNDSYTMLMKNHVDWLRGNPGEYANVIKRSYRLVFNRPATDAEVNYWRGQGTFSYAMLVGAHDTWKKQNPSSAPKTSGKATVSASSGYLATIVVSPGIAAEARAAAGLISDDGSTMVAAGSLNLIGNDAGSLIGNDGGSMVAAGSLNLVAAGAGN